MQYKLIKNNFGIEVGVEVLNENKAVPFDPANTDYQQYLAWLAEGNQPIPAEERQ